MNTVVAVTGLQAVEDPSPGLAVARCLSEAGHYVVGLGAMELTAGFFHSAVEKVQIVEDWRQATKISEQFIDTLKNLCVNILIPTLDFEVALLSKYRDSMRDANIAVLTPSYDQLEARNKACLPELSRRCNLRHPHTVICTDLDQTLDACRSLSYPCLVKGHLYDAHIVETDAQAMAAYQRISQIWGLPVLVQEMIRGEEVSVALLGNGQGQVIRQVQMKKVGITSAGTTWSGVTIKDTSLWKETCKFTEATQWDGVCELEFLRTSNGEYYLFEVNPRFPSWIYLSQIVRNNLPDFAVRKLTGEKLTYAPFDYFTGRSFIRIATEVELPMSKLMSLVQYKEWTHVDNSE